MSLTFAGAMQHRLDFLAACLNQLCKGKNYPLIEGDLTKLRVAISEIRELFAIAADGDPPKVLVQRVLRTAEELIDADEKHDTSLVAEKVQDLLSLMN